jgi:hypothetical protein
MISRRKDAIVLVAGGKRASRKDVQRREGIVSSKLAGSEEGRLVKGYWRKADQDASRDQSAEDREILRIPWY